jgi:hypothetical protein
LIHFSISASRYYLNLYVLEPSSTIRPIALGRKNWLFCGNDDAAENAAIIYSMMGCCKAHHVNFRQWLVYFLENVHSSDNDYSKDLAELLPHNFNRKTESLYRSYPIFEASQSSPNMLEKL